MKLLTNPLLRSIFLVLPLIVVPSSHANTDSTTIELSHTYTPYVNFTGTAPGASRFYDNDDLVTFIFPLSVNLGTMGLESNVGGNCDLNFTTANDFKLLHTVSNVNLGDYTIQYQGQQFNETNNPQLVLPCTTAATNINFILNGFSFSGFDFFIDAGVYQDVVNVVVTTQ